MPISRLTTGFIYQFQGTRGGMDPTFLTRRTPPFGHRRASVSSHLCIRIRSLDLSLFFSMMLPCLRDVDPRFWGLSEEYIVGGLSGRNFDQPPAAMQGKDARCIMNMPAPIIFLWQRNCHRILTEQSPVIIECAMYTNCDVRSTDAKIHVIGMT